MTHQGVKSTETAPGRGHRVGLLMAAPELKAGLATEAASDCEENLIKETPFLEHWGWEGSEGL